MHRDPYPGAAPPDLYEWTLLIRSLETVRHPARTRGPGQRAVIPVGYLLNILKRARRLHYSHHTPPHSHHVPFTSSTTLQFIKYEFSFSDAVTTILFLFYDGVFLRGCFLSEKNVFLNFCNTNIRNCFL